MLLNSVHLESKRKEGNAEQYLGKRLIDRELKDNDWIQFYNFGFRCIREFLVKSSSI